MLRVTAMIPTSRRPDRVAGQPPPQIQLIPGISRKASAAFALTGVRVTHCGLVLVGAAQSGRRATKYGPEK